MTERMKRMNRIVSHARLHFSEVLADRLTERCGQPGDLTLQQIALMGLCRRDALPPFGDHWNTLDVGTVAVGFVKRGHERFAAAEGVAHGGWNTQPRIPSTPLLDEVWRARRAGDLSASDRGDLQVASPKVGDYEAHCAVTLAR